MHCRTKSGSFLALVTLTLLAVASPAWAQGDAVVPTVDIFGGYSWMNPGGHINGVPIKEMPRGFGVNATYNVDKWWGISFDVGGHYGDNADIMTLMVGPRFSFRQEDERVRPFIHFLAGWHRLSPAGLDSSNGFGLATGGGLDVILTRRIDLRLIEADYVYAHHNFGPVLGSANLNGARLRTGLVFKLGIEEPIPPSASCSAEPTEVMAGEAVRVTATGANFSKNATLVYSWSSTGGTVTGEGNVGTVNTAGLGPGSYTVTARVSDNKKKSAECSASFMVKEPPKNPPQMSCSANPTTVQSGESSTVTCSCTSPDGRPVSIAGWSSTGGRVSGSGASATLDTAGAPAGSITVSATCTDDRGLSDSGSAMVNVTVPPPPPQAEKMSECEFPNKVKPGRVDNTCKAVLDDVALRLQRDADSRLVIVGQADANEKKAAALAQQRADNSKTYLVKEKGIDASRIETRAGSEGGRRAEMVIVPPGASY